MQLIETQSLASFQKYLDETKNTICGRNPIQLLLAIIELAKKENYKTEFVKYDQSSQVKSKKDSSVSYASSITT
jgi:AmmeMemoRadiSam system protein B